MQGYVYLIGAGPGDPNLITLRGVQCLAKADVVLYDGLVNPELLTHAPNAERICVGKHGQHPIWSQQAILEELVRHAAAGKTVARLKGGDPAVFARGAEEAEVLYQQGIPYEIVPGITVALAAASYAGVPITHRDHASAVALLTGRQRDKDAAPLDWEALARFPGTLVIYMGVTTAKSWSDSLMAAGKPATTPAAIVRRCTWPDQQVIRCTLGEIENQLSGKVRPPVIVIVGAVANLSNAMTWFDQRPLFGQRVLVTRSAMQADEVRVPLQELGAEVIGQPAIEIGAPESWTHVDQAIDTLNSYDWIIFCSRNGVQSFLRRLIERQRDIRSLAACKIAVVGKRTGLALRDFGCIPDLTPQDFRAEGLLESLSGEVAGQRVLLIRANRGRDAIASGLQARGADVSEIEAYHSSDIKTPDPRVLQMMQRGEIDWVTVSSSAIACSLSEMFGESLQSTKLVSISPITSSTLRELSLEPTCEADPYTMQGMIDAICSNLSSLDNET